MYDTIYECPIVNYQKVIETNDTRHLYKEYDKDKKELNEVYEKLNTQIIDEFGLDELSQMIFHKTKELLKIQNKWIITEDEALETDMQIAERQLEILKKRLDKKSAKDIKKLHASNHRIVSSWSGRDSKKLTVFEYYNDLKDLEAENNARKNK